MRLLTVHKILISAALCLGAILVVWGVVHGRRGDSGAWAVGALGLAVIPAGLLYMRKLIRNPPIR